MRSRLMHLLAVVAVSLASASAAGILAGPGPARAQDRIAAAMPDFPDAADPEPGLARFAVDAAGLAVDGPNSLRIGPDGTVPIAARFQGLATGPILRSATYRLVVELREPCPSCGVDVGDGRDGGAVPAPAALSHWESSGRSMQARSHVNQVIPVALAAAPGTFDLIIRLEYRQQGRDRATGAALDRWQPLSARTYKAIAIR